MPKQFTNLVPGDTVWRAEGNHGYYHFLEYKVLSLTSKGFWVQRCGPGKKEQHKRWLSFSTRKVSISKHDAHTGLMHRKRAQIRILRRQIETLSSDVAGMSASIVRHDKATNRLVSKYSAMDDPMDGLAYAVGNKKPIQ
jgi:hypothetical protein